MVGTLDSKLARGYGTLMGFAFIGTTVLLAPSTFLIEPQPDGTAYLIGVASLFTGFFLIALPWERINPRFLNLIGVAAVVETAIAVEVFGPQYSAIYFLIAIAAAYIAPTPRTVTAQFALIAVGIVAPLTWIDSGERAVVLNALVLLPMIAITGGLVAYLRLRLVADHRSYRNFAEQTLALATRIAGRPLKVGELPVDDPDLPGWTGRAAMGTKVACIGAIVLAAPLVGAGLATAGVKLPGPVDSVYREVGMDLPNQDPNADLRPIDAQPVQSGGEGAPDGQEAQAPSPDSAGDAPPPPPAEQAAPSDPAPPAPAEPGGEAFEGSAPAAPGGGAEPEGLGPPGAQGPEGLGGLLDRVTGAR